MVQKFIFIQENNFNGSKITFESSAESLNQLLTDFADFLRGSGFQINGYLDVINPEEELPNYDSEYDDGPLWQDTKWNDDEELDYDHPEANFDWPEEETAPIANENENLSLCPVCKIDNRIMARNDCYDKNCPKVN